MAGSVNKVTLVGNLTKDPEVRNTQSGGKIVNMTVATSETWNDKQSGERKERSEFHRVVIFNERLAGVAERFLSKGRKVYLEGELRTRKWTDQSGVDKYSTEVTLDRFRGELVLLDSNRSSGAGNSDAPREPEPQREQPKPQPQAQGSSPGMDLDDEIPFAPFVF